VGPFLASSLEIPSGRIAKGLSIKVGDHDEGTVCYETRDGTFRAAWLGGFLQFDPARFGLINAPGIVGEGAFTTPAASAWLGASSRYSGLHLHGKRVILEYRLDSLRVLESPWLVSRANLKVFTRSIEFRRASTR
jgi:hypothetical protein